MRKLVLSLLIAACAPVFARAQTGMGRGGPGSWGPESYGRGEKPTLGYSAPGGSQNSFSLALGADAGYDDNVLDSNVNKQGDEFFSLTPRFTYLRQEKRFTFDVDYDPYFTLYRRVTQWDTINQGLNVNIAYSLSPHWTIRERNAVFYYNISGGQASYTGNTPFPPLGPPSGVNDFIIPGSRSLATANRLDLIYTLSGRTSLDFFGTYFDQSYSHSQTVAVLTSYRSAQGGFGYNYRVTRRDTLGLLYTYEQMQFSQGSSQQKMNSLMATYARTLSPSVEVSVFGGPEYVKSHTTVDLTIPIFGIPVTLAVPINSNGWYAAGGGTLTWHQKRTSATLMANQSITGGNGLSTSGNYTVAMFGVQRQLTQRWTATAGAGYTRFSALSVATNNSAQAPRLQYANASFHLSRALTERLNVDVGYTYWRQRGRSTNPLLGDVSRNRASVGFFYTLGRTSSRGAPPGSVRSY